MTVGEKAYSIVHLATYVSLSQHFKYSLIYIYIYIEREREREREICFLSQTLFFLRKENIIILLYSLSIYLFGLNKVYRNGLLGQNGAKFA